MRPNCPYENCYCRSGKNGFCLKHKEIGEAIQALLMLSKNNNKILMIHPINSYINILIRDGPVADFKIKKTTSNKIKNYLQRILILNS